MKIGYAYVVADMFHIGHLKHLQRCKTCCDKLIVGVLTDEATMEKKLKPIISFEERREIIASIRCVDEAIKQEIYSPLENVKRLKPDILFESTSHTDEAIAEARKLMKEIGGEVVISEYYNLQSSTKIKQKINENR